MLPAGELPLPGGEQTGQHFPNLPPPLPPFLFFLTSLWALWVEGGGTEQKTNLLQFEELRLPTLPEQVHAAAKSCAHC